MATGGLQEWVKTRKLELDGVVTLYQGDGSVYLTEQRYQIYPWSNSIRVSAVEPQGEFVCELSGYGGLRPDELQDGSGHEGRPSSVVLRPSFFVTAGARVVDALPALLNGSDEGPAQVSERDLADAILTIATASIRFLDRSAKFTRASEPVKMQGLWYYPIERAYVVERPARRTFILHRNQPTENGLWAGGRTTASDERRDVGPPEPYWSKVSSFGDSSFGILRRMDLRRMEVFYQNRNNSLVDMVWFADVEEGKFFAVRGYDYSRVQKRGVLLPAKIEIFRTDARSALSERVAQVNFE